MYVHIGPRHICVVMFCVCVCVYVCDTVFVLCDNHESNPSISEDGQIKAEL